MLCCFVLFIYLHDLRLPFCDCNLVGYDDIDGVVDASVKMEGVHGGVTYLDGEMIDEEEQDMAYYDEDIDQFEASEVYQSPKQDTFERPLVPLRKLLPKSKINRQHNNNNNNNSTNANRRQTVGVGHSLSLYRQQPLKNLASRKHFFSFLLLFFTIINDCITPNIQSILIVCDHVINILLKCHLSLQIFMLYIHCYLLAMGK